MPKIRSSAVEVSKEKDKLIHLIREELKSRKLFHIFKQLGLEDCYYLPDLDFLILPGLGLDSEDEKIYERYNAVMDKRCMKINDWDDSLMKQAVEVYRELRR